MNKKYITGLWLAGLAGLAVLLFAVAGPSAAACNNPDNWLEAPDEDTPLHILSFHSIKGDFGNDEVEIFPELLTQEMMDKMGTGAFANGEASIINYYEEDGKGNWRVCREESWWSPNSGDEATRQQKVSFTEKYIANHSVLKKLYAGQMAGFVKLIFYDAKGRLEHISKADFEKPEQPAKITVCRRYDDKDRIVLNLDPKTAQSCAANPPDNRDDWATYEYGVYPGTDGIFDDDSPKAERVLWRIAHMGEADGTWKKSIQPFTAGTGDLAVHGYAEADSKVGVKEIAAMNIGRLDNNAANTVLNHFGDRTGSAYYFTQPPVPLDVVRNPELIHRYERRRKTYIEGQILKLYELFKPNEHVSRHRYYSLDGGLERHEQLDARGKVTRVITINDYRQPRPGPHPDVDDKLLTDKGLSLRLRGHQIYHRVYDLDAQGQPKLVAVSWNRERRIPGTRKTAFDFADVIFSTPDGKTRWSREAFEKKFDTSRTADHVFPDLVGKPLTND